MGENETDSSWREFGFAFIWGRGGLQCAWADYMPLFKRAGLSRSALFDIYIGHGVYAVEKKKKQQTWRKEWANEF